ncbi:MAG: hypothetical protein ABIF17_02335 [Patescibacteria group bacterium]
MKNFKFCLSRIRILFVFSKGEPDDRFLNYDSGIRCQATKEIFNMPNSQLMKIYFIGGKPEKEKDIPVSVQMKIYFDSLTSQAEISEALFKSNNAFGNVREVLDIVKEKKINTISILANKYQLPRFIKMFKNQGIVSLRIFPVEAEQVLILSDCRAEEMKAYLKSSKYKLRTLLEKLLIIWLFFDPEYKIITKWRKFRRSR